MVADIFRHLEGVERRIGGGEVAIVGRDVQVGIGFRVNENVIFPPASAQ
jgi:hypothetical protein